jgi:hypothetical protein
MLLEKSSVGLYASSYFGVRSPLVITNITIKTRTSFNITVAIASFLSSGYGPMKPNYAVGSLHHSQDSLIVSYCFLAAVVISATLLVSCGGGSSAQSPPPPPPSPDFAISVSPTSGIVPPGGVEIIQVLITAKDSFTGSVTVNVSGLPSGATLSPSSPFTMSVGSQMITLALPANAQMGPFSITLQGSSGNLQHSASFALQVEQQQFANFSVTLNNSELSFPQGSSGNTIVGLSLMSSGNSNYEVVFSVVGLPTSSHLRLTKS